MYGNTHFCVLNLRVLRGLVKYYKGMNKSVTLQLFVMLTQ